MKSPAKGTWEKGDKKYSLSFNADNLHVLEENEYLYIQTLQGLKKINLDSFETHEKEFELVTFIQDKGLTKILLKYDHGSRAYTLGMCGAGIEEGYVILTFNKQYELLNKEKLQLESCLEVISSEEIKTADPDETEYIITTNEGTKKLWLNKKTLLIRRQ